MKKIQYDGKDVITRVVQFGQDNHGVFMNAQHCLEINFSFEKLRATFNELTCDFPLQFALIDLLEKWENILSISGDVDLEEITSRYVNKDSPLRHAGFGY